MQRAVPAVLLALLVLGSSVVVATGGAQPGVSDRAEPADLSPVEGTSPNTTKVLQLDAIGESAFDRGDISVANALRASSENVESTLDVYAAETRLAQVTDSGDRERVLRNVTDRAEIQMEGLESREAAARERFLAGEISSREYVAVLGAVNREARHLSTVLDSIEDLATRNSYIEDRVGGLRADAFTHTGPISDELGDAVVGRSRTDRVFVAASEEGVVLSTVRDGAYVRETVRRDVRDETIGGIDFDAAQARIEELYPWAWENYAGASIRSLGQDAIRFQLSHGHGTLNKLLDTSAGNVFREVQTKSLDGLSTTADTTTTVNNTTLVTSRAYAGGPLEIRVENATGAPLEATVAVNGTEIGRTGVDGAVWAISPAGTYNVTARHDDILLNTTVTAR